MTATSQDFTIQFLPLTGEISAPFIPQPIKSLREEHVDTEEAIEGVIIDDILTSPLKYQKERALSNASDIVLVEPIHIRADSS